MESIWEKGIKLPEFKTLDKDINTDVLIIGGGICGILTAHYLKQNGVNAILVEGGKICQRTTKNTTAKITAQHGIIYDKLLSLFGPNSAKLYYEANRDAIEEYAKLCKNLDCDFERISSTVFSRKESNEIKKELSVLRQLNIPVEYSKKTELPFEVCDALTFKNQAQFNPLKFVCEIARELEIYEHTAIVKISGQKAFTKSRQINAKKIIVATHFPFINRYGLYFMKMYQERSYVIALRGADELNGNYIEAESGGLSFRPYKNLLLLGGFSHRTAKKSCQWENLKKAASNLYPDSVSVYKWATQDCMTLDGMPYIGKYSNFSENLFVATGFNKWGMSSSLIAAKMLCDAVLSRKNEYSKLFSPNRSILHKQLLCNLKESALGLIGIGKRCPHLKCKLKWNDTEKTWECSCHGSRFNSNGKVIDNPANKDMY